VTGPSREQILSDLAGILQHYQGREYSEPIDGQTRFFADLGLASIHAVHLAEVLERHYGRPFAFSDFLRGLAERQVEDLEMNDLVEFLYQQMQIQPSV
jgi:acyl carrier protein